MKVLAIASVVELVDTPALGAGSERSAGSSPVRGTLSQTERYLPCRNGQAFQKFGQGRTIPVWS